MNLVQLESCYENHSENGLGRMALENGVRHVLFSNVQGRRMNKCWFIDFMGFLLIRFFWTKRCLKTAANQSTKTSFQIRKSVKVLMALFSHFVELLCS